MSLHLVKLFTVVAVMLLKIELFYKYFTVFSTEKTKQLFYETLSIASRQ